MYPGPAAIDRVRGWARLALQAESGDPRIPRPPDDVPLDELLSAIRRHRLVELLDTSAAQIDLPGHVAQELSRLRAEDRRPLMLQILELSRVADLFAGEGISWLSVKGPALALQTTGDLSGRGRGDIDIFIAPRAVEEVFALLTRLGWVCGTGAVGAPGSWTWRHVLRTYNEMTFIGPRCTIDLHWRLDLTHHGLADFDTSWGRRTSLDVAGVQLQTLGKKDCFAHTCHHAAKDDWRWLRSLVDVHRLARDCDVWSAEGPDRVELTALTVTNLCVGLPFDVPGPVVAEIPPPTKWLTRRVMTAQERPAIVDDRFPGAQTLRGVHYRISSSRTPDDVFRTLLSAALPVDFVVSYADPSERPRLPRLIRLRLWWVIRRLAEWLRGRAKPPTGSRASSPR